MNHKKELDFHRWRGRERRKQSKDREGRAFEAGIWQRSREEQVGKIYAGGSGEA